MQDSVIHVGPNEALYILASKTKVVYIFSDAWWLSLELPIVHYESAIVQGGINTTASDGILWETEIYIVSQKHSPNT